MEVRTVLFALTVMAASGPAGAAAADDCAGQPGPGLVKLALLGLPSFMTTRVRMTADEPIHIRLHYP